MDYENDLNINHDALDVECIEQPMKFMRYSKLAAEALQIADRAKENLAVVEAEVDAEIRTKAKDNGEKTTEAVISGRVTLNGKYRDALSFYEDKLYNVNILNAAVRAFQQRKDSIENLIRLAQMGYFATPSVPRDLSAEMKKRIVNKAEESVDNTKTRVRERLSRSV